MTCREVHERDLPELYCTKRLSAEEAADFEDHYFHCERCFAELRAVEALQTHLRKSRVMRPERRWLAAAAAVLLIAGGAAAWKVSSPAAADPYRELAQVDPPAYTAPSLRGPEPDQVTAAAMADYQAKRYAEALTALDAAAKNDPDNVAAPYYAAACELALGHPEQAARRFGAVGGKGESRLQESAYWYEAKAWIRVRNKAAAVQALTKMLALRGARASEGQMLLGRLQELR